jgi:hypothetical protein
MRRVAALIALWAFPAAAWAGASGKNSTDALVKVVSLGRLQPGTTNRVSVPSDVLLDVRLSDRVPGHTYQWIVEQRVVVIPPMSIFPSVGGVAAAAESPCEALKAALTEAAFAKIDEPSVARYLREEEAFGEEKHLDQSNCPDGVAALSAAKEYAAPVPIYSDAVPRGHELYVTVERLTDAGAIDRTWTYVLTTGSRGSWRATYGFSFTPDDDERFFTQSVGTPTENRFKIMQEHDRADGVFIPALFYTWLPTAHENSTWSPGITGGLGFQGIPGGPDPVVFLGPSLSYNQNLMVTGGVVVRKFLRLNGKYQPGDEVSENLTAEQLQESTYRPQWFVALTFRFDTNPFSKPETKEEKTK